MQTPKMVWNTQKKIWQHLTEDHLFELWEPFLGTWQISGMMRNGQVYELPMQEQPITDSVSSLSHILPTPKARDSQAEGYEAGLRRSTPQVGTIVKGLVENDPRVIDDIELLRTPTASQGEGGALGEEEARRRGNTVGIRDQAMDLAKLNGAKVSRKELDVLPTPTVSDNRGAAKGEVLKGNPKHRLKVEVELLPTTRTSMSNGPTRKEIAEGNPKSRLETEVMLGETNWGKFGPAIRRWEEVVGRSAPAPTKPDGKDGSHRLSSAFTEWLMGVPEGWITDVGLTRNEELKACGNGVVPQQAELALRLLLEGVVLPKTTAETIRMFPTPLVSDSFTGRLRSPQHKEGSMHSVTLAQAVTMVLGTDENDS